MDSVDTVEAEDTSVIGTGILVTGNIETLSDLHIDGQIIGDVRCVTLVLGEDGAIKGGLHAQRAKIAGVTDGTIDTGDLAIEATGSVSGEISYRRLRIETGGLIKGKVVPKGEAENRDGATLDMVGVLSKPRQNKPS